MRKSPSNIINNNQQWTPGAQHMCTSFIAIICSK